MEQDFSELFTDSRFREWWLGDRSSGPLAAQCPMVRPMGPGQDPPGPDLLVAARASLGPPDLFIRPYRPDLVPPDAPPATREQVEWAVRQVAELAHPGDLGLTRAELLAALGAGDGTRPGFLSGVKPEPPPKGRKKAPLTIQQRAWDSALEAHVAYWYYTCLYGPCTTLPVTLRGVTYQSRVVPGHVWNCDGAGGAAPLKPGPRYRCDVMVVGKHPGEEEVRVGRNFWGPTGHLLQATLEDVGFGPAEYGAWYVDNLVKFPNPDPGADDLARSLVQDCWPLLQVTIRLVRPKVILLLGREAIQAVLGKGASIKSTVGQVFQYKYRLPGPDGAPPETAEAEVLTCLHPAAVVRKPEWRDDMVRGLRHFHRHLRLRAGEDAGPAPVRVDPEAARDHRLISTPEALLAWEREVEASGAHACAVDTEFHGLYPGEPDDVAGLPESYLRTVQVSWGWMKAVCIEVTRPFGAVPVIPRALVAEVLTRVLSKRRLVLHYAAADLVWLADLLGEWVIAHFDAPPDDPFPPPPGVPWVQGWEKTTTQGGFDTIFAAHACEETQDLGLKEQALAYTTAGHYGKRLKAYLDKYCSDGSLNGTGKAVKKGDLNGFGMVPIEDLWEYACLHRDSLVQLGDGSWRKIGDLVRDRYSGDVKAYLDGRVVNARVTNWHRRDVGQKEWYKLRTATTRGCRNGLSGPTFTPDHKIVTPRGKVQVRDLAPGQDSIITDETEFSPEQLSVFLGSLLGDGGFTRKNGKGVGFGFGQKASRAAYADWKAEVFADRSPTLVDAGPGCRRYTLPFSRYLRHLSDAFPTHPRTDHRHRKAVITSELLGALGDLGLAVWFQDDGTRVRLKNKSGVLAYRIYCRKLAAPEQELVVEWLTSKFGPTVSYNQKGGFIQISGESRYRFAAAVAPHVHPVFASKLGLPPGGGRPLPQGDRPFAERILEVVRHTPPTISRGHGVRYCLTVEGAGNFLTQAGFVSNCYDADVTYRLFVYYNETQGPGLPGRLDRDRFGNCSREPYWITHRAAPGFLEMRRTGLHLDKTEAGTRRVGFETARDKKLAQLKAAAEWPTFNPNSVYDCRALLFGPEMVGKFDKEGKPNYRVQPLKDPATGRPLLDPATGEPVFPSPQFLYLTPYKTTGKKPQLWEDVVRRGEAHKRDPSTDKESLAILGTGPKGDPRRAVAWMLRDVKYLSQVCKAVLRPPVKDKQDNALDRYGEITDDFEDMEHENGLLSYVCRDSRVRTNFSQTKETGRASSWQPALQNLGKRREGDYKRLFKEVGITYPGPLRSVFVARPGWVLIEADYKGAELAGMAGQAQDAQMMEHVRRMKLDESHPDHYDIHSGVAIEAFRLTMPDGSAVPASKAGLKAYTKAIGQPDKKIRDPAKPVVFGYAYGMGAASAQRKAKEEGADVTLEDAEALIAGLERKYPSLPRYFAEARACSQDPGYLLNAFGRYRRFFPTQDRKVVGDQEREAQNFPIQSLVADAVSRAMDHLYHYPDRPRLGYRLVLQIHDAILFEVPAAHAVEMVDHVIPLCMEAMVPIPVRDLRGGYPDAPPYRLACDRAVYTRWGTKFTAEEAVALGLPETSPGGIKIVGGGD